MIYYGCELFIGFANNIGVPIDQVSLLYLDLLRFKPHSDIINLKTKSLTS